MNRFVVRYCVVFLSAITLLACAREIVPEETTSVSQGPESITITINASNDSESRTMIGEDGASFWTPGDKLAVIQFFHTDQRYHFETSFSGYAESQPLESEGPVPVHQFSVTFPNYMYTFGEEESEWITYDHLADIEGHPGKKFLYQAFYPSETIDSYDYSCPVLHVPSRQRPLADSFDPLADILYSKPVYLESQPSTMDLNFKRFSALGIMTLTGIPDGIGENAVVSSVEFISGITGHENDPGPLQAPRTRANLYNCPPLTGDVYQEDHIFYPENGNYVHDYNALEYVITLDYTGKELKAKGLKAYFTCWPTKFEEETCFTVKVTVDDNGQMKAYTRTVELGNRTLEFSSGVATTFSVNMESAEVSIVRPLSFSESTLQYFPELNSDKPVIKYYNDGSNPYYPFVFTSDYEWEVGFSYDNYANKDWLVWGTIKSIYGDNLYSNCEPNHERRATMVFTCLDNSELSFEIPVEEHFIVQLKKDDVLVEYNSTLRLDEGESFYFTAVLDLPDWAIPESVDIDWNHWDDYYWITPDKDNDFGCWVNGDYPGDDDYFAVYVRFNDIWGSSWSASTGCWIDVVPYHIPLYYNGEDVHNDFVVMSPGQPITLTADLTDLSESDIDKIEWIASDDYEWGDDDSPTYVGGSIFTLNPSGSYPNYSIEVSSSQFGYDSIALIVTLKDGSELWSYCDIQVVLDLFNGDENVAGKSVTLTPGTPITLSADISGILNDIRYAHWFNESDYFWNEESGIYEYVGGGTGISIIPHSENSLSPDYYTVEVSCNAEFGKDVVALQIVLEDGSEIITYCFVNNESGSKSKTLKHAKRPGFQKRQEPHRPRTH